MILHDWNERFLRDVETGRVVLKIENLRIADGSIMPRVTTGQHHGSLRIIGERAGEILWAEHKL
jgi:choline dehydrogenase